MNQKEKYQDAILHLKSIDDEEGMIANALDEIHRYVGELRRERAIPPAAPKVVVDDSASVSNIAELESVKARLQADNKSLRAENKKLRAYLPSIEPSATSMMIVSHLTKTIVKVLNHYKGYNNDKVIALAHVLASTKGKSNRELIQTTNAILEIIDVPLRVNLDK